MDRWNPRILPTMLVGTSKVRVQAACSFTLSVGLSLAAATAQTQAQDAAAATAQVQAAQTQPVQPEQAQPEQAQPEQAQPTAAPPVAASANIDAEVVAAPTLAADIVAPNANIMPLQLLPLTPKHEGGMTAKEVADHALSVSARARRAKADAVRASGRAAQAFSLFLPRVDLKATYTRLSPVAIPSPSLFGQTTTTGSSSSVASLFGLNLLDRYSLQASVRIPVSEYFLTLNDHYSSAQRMDQVSRLQKQGEVQAVVHEAKDYYLNLARAIAARHLAEHRIDQLKAFTADISALVASGELSAVELAQARAREASAESALKSAIANQNIAEGALRAYLDLEPNAPVAINEPLLDTRPGPPDNLNELREHALRQRPEMRALLELAAAQMDTRDAVAGGRYPTLAFFGSINYDNPNQRLVPLQTKFYATWALGAELAWSPTELAVQNSRLDDAELDVARTREDIRALHARIRIEVTTAYENAVAAESAITAAEAAVAAAQESLDARTSLFHSGEATSREVLDAELDLRVAQLNYIDNVLSTHLARAALDHAAGLTAASN